MKKLVVLLLCASSAYAEEKVTVNKQTADLCMNLVGQLTVSAQDPKLVETSQRIAAAVADLKKPAPASSKKKREE